MQLRNALAIILSISLLCVASWASACELSCSLSPGFPVPDHEGFHGDASK